MQVQSLGLKDPWSRKWRHTPVFLPGKSHRQEKPGSLELSGVEKSQTVLSTHVDTPPGTGLFLSLWVVR